MKAYARHAAVAAALVLGAGLALSSFAQQAEQADEADATPIARVGERVITEEDVALAQSDFAQELARVPEAARRGVLIDVLIDMEVLAQAARERGMHETEDFQRRQALLEARALRNLFVEQEIMATVTAEEVEAEYERQAGQFEPEEEVRARHILVETEAEARELIEALDEDADFAELAREHSMDPGAQNGDLGYFGRGRMVPAFEEAAFALEPGTHTEEPVESQFGWHVIKVEDRRMTEPPPLEEMAGQIRVALMRAKFEEVMAELREQTDIEILAVPRIPPREGAPEPQEPEAAPDPAR
jgi:peptidyl-prolyl cis-trans isomerase C